MKVVKNKQTILIIRFDRCFLDLLRTEDLKDYFSGKLDATLKSCISKTLSAKMNIIISLMLLKQREH
ncbi:MAG: hypothetical protein ACLTMR_09685 [Faecalibacillus sp.]